MKNISYKTALPFQAPFAMALSENQGHDFIYIIWPLYAYGENHFTQDALWMPIKFIYKFPHNIIYDCSFLFNVFILFKSKS